MIVSLGVESENVELGKLTVIYIKSILKEYLVQFRDDPVKKAGVNVFCQRVSRKFSFYSIQGLYQGVVDGRDLPVYQP